MEKFFLLSFLTGSALCDFRKGRVPNVLILFGTAAFGIAGFIRGPSPGDGSGAVFTVIALFFIRTFFTVIIFFPLFLFRMMGAGDIKVMAVIAGCGRVVFILYAEAAYSCRTYQIFPELY